MRVENIECQIAQGQMTRYLSGETLGTDVASELKAHIAGCPDCAEVLDAKRSVLRAMLGTNAVIGLEDADDEAAPARLETCESRFQPLVNLLRNRAGRSVDDSAKAARPTIGRSWQKAGAYAAALALVALGMTQVLNDPTKLFGERASNTNSITPPAATPPASPANTSEAALESDAARDTVSPSRVASAPAAAEASVAAALPAPVGGAAQTPSKPVPEVSQPAKGPAPKPRVAVTAKKPERRVAASRPTRKSGPARRSGGSIRVYGSDGRPISQ